MSRREVLALGTENPAVSRKDENSRRDQKKNWVPRTATPAGLWLWGPKILQCRESSAGALGALCRDSGESSAPCRAPRGKRERRSARTARLQTVRGTFAEFSQSFRRALPEPSQTSRRTFAEASQDFHRTPADAAVRRQPSDPIAANHRTRPPHQQQRRASLQQWIAAGLVPYPHGMLILTCKKSLITLC